MIVTLTRGVGRVLKQFPDEAIHMQPSDCSRLMFPSLVALLSLAAVMSFSSSPLAAQALGGAASKENLDLPYDAGLFNSEVDDEDAPEVIQFYDQQYEGDGVFFAIDRSGSMQGSGELDIAKREVSKNISEFSTRVQFGIVFFDNGLLKFPTSGRPAEAAPSMKAAALNWVNSVKGGNGSCCQQGLVAAMQYANFSSAKRKVIIYVGDGGGTCNGADEGTYLKQTLAIIRSQNFQRAQVNCVGVLQIGPIQNDFLSSLAQANGGTYTKVTR